MSRLLRSGGVALAVLCAFALVPAAQAGDQTVQANEQTAEFTNQTEWDQTEWNSSWGDQEQWYDPSDWFDANDRGASGDYYTSYYDGGDTEYGYDEYWTEDDAGSEYGFDEESYGDYDYDYGYDYYTEEWYADDAEFDEWWE